MIGKNRFFLLFNHTNFQLAYISQNFYKLFDFPAKVSYSKILSFAFKRFHWKQLGVLVNFTRWGHKFLDDYGNKALTLQHYRYFCGLKLRHKDGGFRTLFGKIKFLVTNDQGDVILSFGELEDVTHLFKSDTYWMRLTAKNEDCSFSRFHIPTGSKKMFNDVLSVRELEILKLCAQQKDNKEIGELLGISFQTVKKHRKNMIARTGVKDIAGLLHICNLCDLI